MIDRPFTNRQQLLKILCWEVLHSKYIAQFAMGWRVATHRSITFDTENFYEDATVKIVTLPHELKQLYRKYSKYCTSGAFFLRHGV